MANYNKNELFSERNYEIEQYVYGICDYSSEYGTENSISYTAQNVIGKLSRYPNYGDFPETYSMRTYGTWWKKMPLNMKELQRQNLCKIVADDFIVLYFEESVTPIEISIFETYNPGAVVRIWAYCETGKWYCIWETRSIEFFNERIARKFSPVLKINPIIVTKIIRIEFNHNNLSYFTAIDGVLLKGLRVAATTQETTTTTRRAQQQQGLIEEKYLVFSQEQLRSDIAEIHEEYTTRSHFEEAPEELELELDELPYELLYTIFSFLDLKSLFRIGQVCKRFYRISLSPLLYSELNLKPYWPVTNGKLLTILCARATMLKKLDLSWCGLLNMITPIDFKRFIRRRGKNLTILRVNSCRFINTNCVKVIANFCYNLLELSLANCELDGILENAASLTNLKNLERLNLFRTCLGTEVLLLLIENNPNLKYLNLALSGATMDMDAVLQCIAKYNKKLIALDIFKCHHITAASLKSLSDCHDLEELDLGWSLRDALLGNSLQVFLKKCTKLRKLFLAAANGITDIDLFCIAHLCSNLEQLDLMSVNTVTYETAYEILKNCHKLELIDVSFCERLLSRYLDMDLLSQRYNVEIKYNSVPFETN